jgi:hypothetical protein
VKRSEWWVFPVIAALILIGIFANSPATLLIGIGWLTAAGFTFKTKGTKSAWYLVGGGLMVYIAWQNPLGAALTPVGGEMESVPVASFWIIWGVIAIGAGLVNLFRWIAER